MVSIRSSLKPESPYTNSHPCLAAMTDTNTLQQLQNHIAEMERRQEEELTKLKADYGRLEACAKCPQDDDQSSYTLPKRTQGESHPRRTGNTADDLSPSYMHHLAAQTVCQHPFVDRIMEEDIPLGWKPLNLEWYDGTTDPDEHLDAFLTQTNLYTNNDAILCCVFLRSLKGATLTW